MGKPTAAELQEALETAAQMREQDNDPHYVAKALLNLNYRMGYMEKVLHAAQLYLRGLGEHEHAALQKAIDAARREEAHTGGRDMDHFI
ncbi:hypothetical protein [Sulfuriflexus sp.]|uniref:hypothetical protein n=1 Tax=Sulfuriflexus sp. TaxID=2015443 RepID=UPI0028CF5E44|nr:hypothetical protein [Sulfuriflexus sp.]MDT8404246.1 hypothetical protein [Sulfuriflexus sp.]